MFTIKYLIWHFLLIFARNFDFKTTNSANKNIIRKIRNFSKVQIWISDSEFKTFKTTKLSKMVPEEKEIGKTILKVTIFYKAVKNQSLFCMRTNKLLLIIGTYHWHPS